MENAKNLRNQTDWFAMIVPLCIVIILCIVFMILPEQSTIMLQTIRGFLGDAGSIYYALLGLGIFLCTMYMAFSKYGSIRLGQKEDVKYTSFQWGTMIFTSTMAADILFYSLCEWALYANEPYIETLDRKSVV